MPPARGTPTKKDLEILVAELQQKLTLETNQRDTAVTELETTRATIHQLQTDLTAAQAEADAARAAAAAAQAAQAQVAAAAPGHAPLIPRPAGLIRQLREHSGLDHVDYKACQRTIRNLVVMGGLDVTQDFRRHDPEDLAKIYRAAREAHPILKRYQNNWLTAELAKQYLQNRRKHAVRRGYIERGMLKTSARRRREPSAEIPV